MKSLNASSSAAGVPEMSRTPATDHPHAGTSGDLFPGTTPAELVELVHDQPMTTSRRVADYFGKPHSNVVRAITAQSARLADDPVLSAFNALNFERVEYLDAKGETRHEYRMTSAGFSSVALAFTGKEAARLRVRFVMAFDRMARALRRQQNAAVSRERELIRSEVARTHSTVNAVLTDTRAERGKTTEAHHYVNEAKLIGYAMTGQPCRIDRNALDAPALRLLRWVEMQDIKLLIRGVHDYPTRKAELRALVLKAQATAQALEAGDAEPLQSIGGAA